MMWEVVGVADVRTHAPSLSPCTRPLACEIASAGGGSGHGGTASRRGSRARGGAWTRAAWHANPATERRRRGAELWTANRPWMSVAGCRVHHVVAKGLEAAASGGGGGIQHAMTQPSRGQGCGWWWWGPACYGIMP
eukprot:357329-Chlamydomonas_euryale.AAC.19